MGTCQQNYVMENMFCLETFPEMLGSFGIEHIFSVGGLRIVFRLASHMTQLVVIIPFNSTFTPDLNSLVSTQLLKESVF